jgi:hypothetical protein
MIGIAIKSYETSSFNMTEYPVCYNGGTVLVFHSALGATRGGSRAK